MTTKLCECGCGGVAPVASQTNKKWGHVKGEPIRFIAGHHRRLNHYEVGKIKEGRGYLVVRIPDHPRADGRGYVKEQVLVMEKALGRLILSMEAIHHINGDKTDNSISNLMLFKTHGMHRSYHERLKAYSASGHYDWRKCPICHRFDDPSNMTIRNVHPAPKTKAYHKKCASEYERNRKMRVNQNV